MNIEQKMAYLRKAIEMGADVEVSFHDFNTQEEASAAVANLNEVVELDFIKKSPIKEDGSNLRWFKAISREAGLQKLEVAIFFNEAKEEETANEAV